MASPRRAAAVIGATGGIGRAIVENLMGDDRFHRVVALSRSGTRVGGAEAAHIDLTEENSISKAAEAVGDVDLVIVASGLLHGDGYGPEKNMQVLTQQHLQRAFSVNAIGPALVAKHFIPHLPRRQRGTFAALSARVGSIADNRLGGWYGYRASKAALNQLIRTLAIETARSRPHAICVALHPGTVDTPLSAPFQSNVPRDRLFLPTYAAHSGRIFDWAGEEIVP
jgi:NAD(P)-dependent dehydrogenase (short-subunit alcohol dehydrogenase family)